MLKTEALGLSVFDMVAERTLTVACVAIGGIEAVTVFGGSGDDRLQGGYEGGALHGRDSDDTLGGGYGWDSLHGGRGDDYLGAFDSSGGRVAGDEDADEENLHLKDAADVFRVADTLAGTVTAAGFEVSGIERVWLKGEGGDDRLSGGVYSDTIEGGQGHEALRGEAGDDRLCGDGADDLLAGSDQLFGGGSNDVLHAEDAPGAAGLAARALLAEGDADALDGGAGADVLHAAAGARLTGGEGGDTFVLDGGAGRDALAGGEGADLLTGGRGDDARSGGGGHDRFVFAPGDGRDPILDFRAGMGEGDVLDLQGAGIETFDELMAQVSLSRRGHVASSSAIATR